MKKKDIQQRISATLQEAGFLYTTQQCIERIKTLLDAFKKTTDHNRISGNSAKTCKYYDQMENLMQGKPSINPVAICISRSPAASLKLHTYHKKERESSTEEEVNVEVLPRPRLSYEFLWKILMKVITNFTLH